MNFIPLITIPGNSKMNGVIIIMRIAVQFLAWYIQLVLAVE